MLVFKKYILLAIFMCIAGTAFSQWLDISGNFPGEFQFTDIADAYFHDDLTGWVINANATILKTTNGGQSWSAQSTVDERSLTNIHFPEDDQTGYVFGYYGTPRNLFIQKTTDGGDHWSQVGTNSNNVVNGFHFFDKDNFWAVGDDGVIMKTADGGVNWTEKNSGTDNILNDVFFVNEQIGWVVGRGSSETQGQFGRVLYTNDGGETWTNQTTTSNIWLTRVHFHDENVGWASGFIRLTGTNPPPPRYVMHRTYDGGTTWENIMEGEGWVLADMKFVDRDRGWIVGWGSRILHTEDQGTTWVEVNTPTTFNLNFIKISQGKKAWAGGVLGKLLVTESPVEVSVDKPDSELPNQMVLHQNYPNPFNPSTNISFSLPQPQEVTLGIYSINGQLIAELAHGFFSQGRHNVLWDASGVASGIYLAQLKSRGYSETIKLSVIK